MLDKKFIEKQKQKLVHKKEQIEKEFKGMKFPNYGTSEDDNVLEMEDFQESLAQQKGDRKNLKEINAALLRIEKGTYGRCLEDGKTIELGRLQAFPEAAYCRVHASKRK